ncbi:O-antigen polymerase [Agaricicola taiwanensis]|uniref:O-antigen polymerase n=1 Tax=Agaricicola taiwanensis TaxID=591372 RepID=A0A8J2YKN3_9RHOB|nr:O-antigen ligase [Agaricicola taiwanensis]GGE48873.1 O-antigen polymerase [Agaricicola taiwanensis]
MSLSATDRMPQTPAVGRDSRIDPFETALVVIGLVVISSMLRSLILANTGDADREAGGMVQQLVLFAIYGGAMGFLIVGGITRRLGEVLKESWPLLLLVLLPLASVLWSDSPATSLRRAVAFMLTVSFAYYVVARFTLSEIVRILFWVLVAYMAVGLLAAVALPRIGLSSAGDWRGLTGHKNEFGRVLSLIIAIAVVFRSVGTRMWRTWWLPMVVVAFGLLVLSNSKTSLVAAVAGIGGSIFLTFLFTGRFSRFRFAPEVRTVVGVLAFLTVLFLVFIAAPIILEALGRDLTLSGRTRLWQWAIGLGSQHPWLGSGYRAFWIDENTKYFFEFFYWGADADGNQNDHYAGPGNGHNGYLDVWLELGYLGLAVLFIMIGWAVRQIKACLQSGRELEGKFLALILSYLLVYSITERVILQHTELVWFLFMLVLIYSCRACAQDPVVEPVSAPRRPVLRYPGRST